METKVPIGTLVLMLVAIPVAVSVFFGALAFKHITPLAYRCQRCGREFRRPAWRRFPRRCAHCHATDWNRA